MERKKGVQRTLILIMVVLLCGFVFALTSPAAEKFPAREITMVVQFAPGVPSI